MHHILVLRQVLAPRQVLVLLQVSILRQVLVVRQVLVLPECRVLEEDNRYDKVKHLAVGHTVRPFLALENFGRRKGSKKSRGHQGESH